MRMFKNTLTRAFVGLSLIPFFFAANFAQQSNEKRRDENQTVRTVTIPISIFTKQEIKENQTGEFVQAGNLLVREDGDEQTILSIRSVVNTPLAIAVLIQDDLTSSVNLQLDGIRKFIRGLPQGSRVMVAYLRGGSLQIRQKFTEDLERAAKSVRIVAASSDFSSGNPYEQVEDAIKRFDALPTGRRAILFVSDGLDTSRGAESSSPAQNFDLDRAVSKAQRKSIAVYSFYNASSLTENGNSILALNGQGSLNRLSEETGGRAFFQGTGSPVSFDPFFRDLNNSLNRQFALTYLSTHFKKGFHKIEVTSTNPDVRIEHPKGYFYKQR